MNQVLDIFEAVNDIDSTRKYIRQKLTENDRELSKLYHDIDINKDLDMYNGYLVYKQLKNIVIRRTKIKKAMSVFDMSKINKNNRKNRKR